MSAREVFITACGSVSCAGVGVAALARTLAEPEWAATLGLERPDAPPLEVTTCRDFTVPAHLSPLVARRLDRPARLLAAAAHQALTAAGEPLPWPRDRIGVCAATWNAGTDALVQVLRAVFLAGPQEAPPAQFPSTVANAPASQLGILEKLTGPNLTFFEKQAGGLRAVTEAARLLRHGRVDAVLACGVDEAQWLNAESYERLGVLRRGARPGLLLGEGAVALLLVGEPVAQALARLAGWGSAGAAAAPHRYPQTPASLVAACRTALAAAQIEAAEIDVVLSLTNGLPALDKLERAALLELFGPHRPAVVGATDRIGEGAFASTLRCLLAVLMVAGQLEPRWAPPQHLANAGFPAIATRPRRALVTALAAGGSAIAAIVEG
ncbi:MAG: beta-ketoacyl synthase N-terminal-like domain-containing protein [Acidobacteriota bacterium]